MLDRATGIHAQGSARSAQEQNTALEDGNVSLLTAECCCPSHPLSLPLSAPTGVHSLVILFTVPPSLFLSLSPSFSPSPLSLLLHSPSQQGNCIIFKMEHASFLLISYPSLKVSPEAGGRVGSVITSHRGNQE